MKKVISIPNITNYTLALEENKLFYKITNSSDDTYIPISSDITDVLTGTLIDYYTKLESNDLLDTKDNKLEFRSVGGISALSSNIFYYRTRYNE